MFESLLTDEQRALREGVRGLPWKSKVAAIEELGVLRGEGL